MQLGQKRCYGCETEFGEGERTATCPTCGHGFHEECAEYHAGFDAKCGEEKWIGAVEY